MEFSETMIMGRGNCSSPCPRNCPRLHSLDVVNSFIEFGPTDNPKRGRIITYIHHFRFIVRTLSGEEINLSLKTFFDFVTPLHEEQDKLDNDNDKDKNKRHRY